MWDPGTYLRYADERSRPFFELVARVADQSPAEVVDLGCGPGTLTVELARRWPAARVSGIDSSAEMIESARASGAATTVSFDVGDVVDWHAGAQVDVVIANAVLQWVPEHEALLDRWVGELRSGATLAFQVPGNFDAASHRLIREVAGDDRWSDQLAGVLRGAEAVSEPAGYARRLLDAGCRVDAWETTYLHVLAASAGGDHPVLAWTEGTALRPVRAALDDAAWRAYRAGLNARLGTAYPIHNGQVVFPFRRVFVVATVS